MPKYIVDVFVESVSKEEHNDLRYELGNLNRPLDFVVDDSGNVEIIDKD